MSVATPAQGILPDQNLSLRTLWTGCPEITATRGDDSVWKWHQLGTVGIARLLVSSDS